MPWITHAWFDYLNLRQNGLAFYRDLVAGDIPYTDMRVKRVLEYWKEMLENGCFIENHQAYTTWESFPMLFHEHAAAILSSGVPPGKVSSRLLDDLGVTQFSAIKPEFAKYTLAPVNAFVLPSYVQVTPNLEN